jgi:hypothetical protein
MNFQATLALVAPISAHGCPLRAQGGRQMELHQVVALYERARRTLPPA